MAHNDVKYTATQGAADTGKNDTMHPETLSAKTADTSENSEPADGDQAVKPAQSQEPAASAEHSGHGSRDDDEEAREAQLEARMSYADLQRRHSHPKYVALAVLALLTAIVVPYAWGRWLAFHRTHQLADFLGIFDPRGIAFVSWSVTAFALMSVAMIFLGKNRWVWTAVFTVLLACEQFIAGFCLLKWDFSYSTNAVYGRSAMGANAANVGIIATMIALCVFVVLFVLILVIIRKDSPLNVLTQDWAALIMYWVVEVVALMIVFAMFS